MWVDKGFSLDKASGLISPARQVPSPNFNERPQDTEIRLIVVHGISLPPGEFGGSYIDDLFLNRLDPEMHPYFKGIAALTVSSHILVDRQGAVTQYVPLHKRAWHAGQSQFRGITDCNNYSIGIELEGADEVPYENIQYACLGKLINLLMASYPAIQSESVVGHSTIAPGRKTDPGPAFDWDKLRSSVINLRASSFG